MLVLHRNLRCDKTAPPPAPLARRSRVAALASIRSEAAGRPVPQTSGGRRITFPGLSPGGGPARLRCSFHKRTLCRAGRRFFPKPLAAREALGARLSRRTILL